MSCLIPFVSILTLNFGERGKKGIYVSNLAIFYNLQLIYLQMSSQALNKIQRRKKQSEF